MLEESQIKSFQAFKENFIQKLDLKSLNFLHQVEENMIIFYILDCKTAPKITFSLKVLDDLTFFLYKENNILKAQDACQFQGKFIKNWSEIQDILKNFSEFSKHSKSINDFDIVIHNLIQTCKELISYLDNGFHHDEEVRLKFLGEQILMTLKENNRYSPEAIIYSYIIFSESRGAYNAIRENKFLKLPHPKHLQNLSSNFDINIKNETSNKRFLKFMTQSLSELEKIVILTMDEIYVKPFVTYKTGCLTGMSENRVDDAARTIQAFMVHSAFGNFKEIVALTPVQNLDGNYLAQVAKNIVNLVQDCDLQVLVIMSDNHGVNGVAFDVLYADWGVGSLFQIKNPKYDAPIFLMFDTVHIFKNIRNNWLNQKNYGRTFIFPDFESLDSSRTSNEIRAKEACFSDLRDLYNVEAAMIVKKAYKLNFKTLYPNKMERQNVKLVDNIFHDSTIAALEAYSEVNKHFTSEFLKTVKK